jgi:hypothetical protein
MMKTLKIVWQRLVDESGSTCPRCSSTQQEIERAVARLQAALAPLGVQPQLETRTLSPDAFRAAPLDSNRIWIDGRPLEEWLQGQPGASPCCAACGSANCRTLEVGDRTYEAIPERLLLKAGLIAASRLLDS